MKKEDLEETSMGDLVARLPSCWNFLNESALQPFRYREIELGEVCMQQGVELETVLDTLDQILSENPEEPALVEAGRLDSLARFVFENYHVPQKKMIEEIRLKLATSVEVHLSEFPFLGELKIIFGLFSREILLHFAKEENEIFPLLQKMDLPESGNERPQPMVFGVVSKRIRDLEDDHFEAQEELRRMMKLTDDFTPIRPSSFLDELYESVRGFISQLDLHILVENYGLLPMAIHREQLLSH